MTKSAMRDAWYPVGLISQTDDAGKETLLMGEGLRVFVLKTVRLPLKHCRTGSSVCERYGHVWTSLGEPPKALFDIPEAEQAGRRLVGCRCRTRQVFSLARCRKLPRYRHFPFVHTDILGAEPHTEVQKYEVGYAKRKMRSGQRR